MSPTPWSRTSGLAVATVLAGLAAVVPSPLTSVAQLTDSHPVAGNRVSTRAACVGGPVYAAAVLAASPSFYWRVGERTPPAVTVVDDASAANLDGTVRGTGLTFGPTIAGLVACDTTYAVQLRGRTTDNGFLVQATAVPNTDTFTISAWVQTASARGGWVVGMGSSRWGTSTNRDRVLYLQSNGRPSFSVGLAPRATIEGTTAVNDNQPHHLVATLSPAGMALYVDGVQVASNPAVTGGAYYTGNEPANQPPPANPATPDGFGYWRVGYNARAGLGPAVPLRDQFTGRIDDVAVWQSRALTASEVADLFAQNHW